MSQLLPPRSPVSSPRRTSRSLLGGLVLGVLGLVAVSCAVDLSPYLRDTSGVFYGSEELGFSVTEMEEWGESAVVLADGSVELTGTGLVTLPGREAHLVDAIASVEPLAEGARRTLATVDTVTGEERVFHYDLEENAVVVGDFDGGVFVFGNPDGSYDVVTSRFDAPASEDEYEHAADGIAAWHIVNDYNEFTGGSPHGVVMAIAMGQGPSLDARAAWSCVMPDCPTHCGQGAEGPTICDVFDELCTCVMCWAFDGTTDVCNACDE